MPSLRNANLRTLLLLAAAANSASAAVAIAAGKATTAFSACPGYKSAYLALESYSASASFCSALLPIVPVTKTVTGVTTATAYTTVESTVTVYTTTSILPTCTYTAPARKRARDSADAPLPIHHEQRGVAKAATTTKTTTTKVTIPPALTPYARTALSSGCKCLSFPTVTTTTTISVTISTTSTGVPGTTSLSTALTTTVTSTETAPASFYLQAGGSGTFVDGQYLDFVSIDNDGSRQSSVFNATEPSNAGVFDINATNGFLEVAAGVWTGYTAVQYPDVGISQLFFCSANAAASDGEVGVECCVNGAGELDCSLGTSSVFSVVFGDYESDYEALQLGSTEASYAYDLDTVVLQVVPA